MTGRDPRYKTFEMRYGEAVEALQAHTEALLALAPEDRNPWRFSGEFIQILHREGWRPRCAAYDEPAANEGRANPDRTAALLAEFKANRPQPADEGSR